MRLLSILQPCTSCSAASCSGRRATAAPPPASCLRPTLRLRRLPAAAAEGGGEPHPEEGAAPDGNSGLQDSLVKQLQFEIGKKKVDEFVEEEAEVLRAKAAEGKAELDRLADLQNLKAEVAFNSALADINREADEFEEQLRKSREEREKAEADLEQWEVDVAVARSQGQFFQSLYPTKNKRPAGMQAEQIKERANKVVQPAKKEVGSSLRYYLFAFLAFALASEVAVDLQSEAPSAFQDVIYTLLVILLGVTAYNERKSLL